MIINETFKTNLRFPEHTKEKLDGIKYYSKIWFYIVKRQKTYIIDCYAGTGYCVIEDSIKKIKGTALLAIDLFKKDIKDNLKVFLINNSAEECELLKKNASNYIKNKNIKAHLESEIIIKNEDWRSVVPEILEQTSDGIRLFLLDPFGIKSMPWKSVESLIKNAKSKFGYKESGFEVLINWAWHKIRRIIGIYYKNRKNNKEFENLDNFFGPVEWREIVDKYSPNIFKDNINDQIEQLAYELIQAYVKHFFNYFKYVKVHPIHARKKRKEPHLKDKGKIKYFIIFASNYYEALNIIDRPFKESREAKIFTSVPRTQHTLSNWVPKDITPTIKKVDKIIDINDKIKRLETEIGDKIFKKSKEIIKFLYRQKNQDYGCPAFALCKQFEIDEGCYLPYLMEKKLIKKRIKESKSRNVFNYYYLVHPILVDRGEYLFLNDKIFEYKKEEFIEINDNAHMSIKI